MAGVLTEYGRLDAVVACAGWGLAGAVEHAASTTPGTSWRPTSGGRSACPVRAAGHAHRRGGAVLVSSIGGILGIPFQAFYSASKFAMEGYGEALAYEVAPFGIHVTLVEPGNVRTDFTASRRDVEVPEGPDAYASATARAIETMERDSATACRPVTWPPSSSRCWHRGGRRGGHRWASSANGSGSWASACSPTASSRRRPRAVWASDRPAATCDVAPTRGEGTGDRLTNSVDPARPGRPGPPDRPRRPDG